MGAVLVSEEHSLPTESKPIDRKWEFFIDGAIHRALERMAVRIEGAMSSTRGEPERDYPQQPLTAKDLERFIQRIAREQDHSVHIHSSNQGRSEPPKWLNKFILGVGILIAASAVTATATVIITVASVTTKVDDYIKSNDQRVNGIEEGQRELQRRLDRGAHL